MTERAARLKELVEETGLSYDLLAKQIGVSSSTLQRYATEEQESESIKRWEKIAEFFGVDVAYLMNWQEIKKLNSLDDTAETLREINEIAASLPDAFQKTALEQLRVLKNLAVGTGSDINR